MGVVKAASLLRIARHNACAIVRLMREWGADVSDSRIATTCYADVTVQPEEVAEWFGRSLDWAEHAYRARKYLRRRWKSSMELERRACGLYQTDPHPSVIDKLCQRYLVNSGEGKESRVLDNAEFARRWHAASVSKVSV